MLLFRRDSLVIGMGNDIKRGEHESEEYMNFYKGCVHQVVEC